MARKFESKAEKRGARERAEAHFGGKNKGANAAKGGPRVLPDLLAGANGPKAKDFLHHFTTCRGFKDKLETSQGHYRNALKQAKESGIDPAVITATMKWQKKDQLDVQQYFKQLRSTFEVASIEVQLDIFSESSISRPAQIFDDGFKAGRAAKSPDTNPHAMNTPAGQQWHSGWTAGQAENMAGIGKTPDDEAEQAAA
jgi:ribosome modulation factor